jgi:hypothetical protein
MSRKDYEAISKIIEEVVGSDTIQGIKLLEGLRYYLDNKVEKISIINDRFSQSTPANFKKVSLFCNEADRAMERYTKKLETANEKLKASGKYCGVEE